MFKFLSRLGLVLFEEEVKPPVKVEFTKEQQDAVNAIVQDRLAREKDKYRDYDDLVKFKTDHQKQLDAQTQKDLEARKEYDKLKELHGKELADAKAVITQKDQALLDARIGYNLDAELSKQNAYIEEARALLKSNVKVDAEGNLYIDGKDANNMPIKFTIEQGIKDFLTKRPHLVKANARPGAGTLPAGGDGGAGAGGADDLMKLNEEYIVAHTSGNHKRAQEIRTKIKGILTAKGVNRSA